jgi:hypothetical protein
LIDARCKQTILPGVVHLGQFSEDLAPVRLGQTLAYIDHTGKTQIQLQSDEQHCNGFSNGLAAVEKGDKWGYIDHTGKFVIEPQFLEAHDFHDGFASVCMRAEEPKQGHNKRRLQWGAIDRTGKIRFSMFCRAIGQFADGVAPYVKDVSHCGYVDIDGNTIDGEYKRAAPFSEGLAAVLLQEPGSGESWCYDDRQGNIVIRCKFAEPRGHLSPGSFSEGLARIWKADATGLKWGYIDHKGNWAIAAKYRHAGDFSEGIAAVSFLELPQTKTRP